jgi:hypothetical protein
MNNYGAFSPPLSSATSYTAGMQSRLNIVSRLAIEGKAREGRGKHEEGAAIRLYLRVCDTALNIEMPV